MHLCGRNRIFSFEVSLEDADCYLSLTLAIASSLCMIYIYCTCWYKYKEVRTYQSAVNNAANRNPSVYFILIHSQTTKYCQRITLFYVTEQWLHCIHTTPRATRGMSNHAQVSPNRPATVFIMQSSNALRMRRATSPQPPPAIIMFIAPHTNLSSRSVKMSLPNDSFLSCGVFKSRLHVPPNRWNTSS